MDAHYEVIDAFVDGERVDTAALRAALAESEGRDYFVDAWMLREAVQQDAEASLTGHSVAAVRPRRTTGRWIIAATLAAGLGGGYLLGHQSLRFMTPAAAPPPPLRTVAVVPARAVFPAPQPTRVIQLEFQVDATKSGGD